MQKRNTVRNSSIDVIAVRTTFIYWNSICAYGNRKTIKPDTTKTCFIFNLSFSVSARKIYLRDSLQTSPLISSELIIYY